MNYLLDAQKCMQYGNNFRYLKMLKKSESNGSLPL